MSPTVHRILDVNLNRAREALRTIEDYARFALDDAAAAAQAKRVRHALRAIDEALGPRDRLAERDIAGDVGRDTRTAAELVRETPEDVVRAAFGRLTESARGIAEFGKLVSPDTAAAAERLRYDAYDLELRIVLRGGARQRFRAVRLYVIITEALCRRPWVETADAALRGGAACLQLREKSLPDRELLARARRLRDLTAEHGALFVVNDRPDIARLVRADGAHVGQDDLSVADARHVGGAALLVGKSTHTPEQFAAAAAESPDYVAIGPMFPTSTKPQEHIAGPETLSAVAAAADFPIVAIGGVTAANATGLIERGAGCVCVCSGVISAADPERAAREIAGRTGPCCG